MKLVIRWVRIAMLSFAAIMLIGALLFTWLWQDRTSIDQLDWPVAAPSIRTGDEVTVTWLGVSTLLFDDGDTQILTDGHFTRASLLELSLILPLESDVATINRVMSDFRINRLAAIVPVHSHFDHAMDVGIVANRSTAVILGSESTANIARGANVPVNQYQILANGESRQFGNFTITLISSQHAPIAFGDGVFFPGAINRPLRQPVRVSEYKEGTSFSVLISHPRGTALVQGSAGFIERNLHNQSADVVMLGVSGLDRLGSSYARQYWTETVAATGANRVFPIHFDDFTRPFGELELFPDFIDDVVQTAIWIDEYSQAGEQPIPVERLPIGEPIVLY